MSLLYFPPPILLLKDETIGCKYERRQCLVQWSEAGVNVDHIWSIVYEFKLYGDRRD